MELLSWSLDQDVDEVDPSRTKICPRQRWTVLVFIPGTLREQGGAADAQMCCEQGDIRRRMKASTFHQDRWISGWRRAEAARLSYSEPVLKVTLSQAAWRRRCAAPRAPLSPDTRPHTTEMLMKTLGDVVDFIGHGVGSSEEHSHANGVHVPLAGCARAEVLSAFCSKDLRLG